MNILEIDEKRNKVVIRLTNIDDLWFLNNFLEDGDIIFGTIFRKEEERSDALRSKKSERTRINVGIEVEKMEFQDFSNRLRIQGIIRIGPEDYLGLHQSMNIEPGMQIEIVKKEWKKFYIDELKKAEESGQKALFVSIDDEEVTIAMLRDYAIQNIAEIMLKKQSKDSDEKEQQQNYSEIIKKISQYWTEEMPLIIVGPGFFKEKLYNSIPDSEPFKKNVFLVDTSYAGEKGIYEALRSGMLDQILRKHRLNMEVALVNELLNEIGKDGKSAYGMEEVKKALDFGAVQKLIVADSLIRDKSVIELMKMAEKQNAEIYIISTRHEYGKILKNLGGLGAILRYSLS